MKDPNTKALNQQNELGLDVEEQEMNGLYGMAETTEEDALNNQTTQQKK